MRSMQCNVKYVYQLCICSVTEENYGNSGLYWPVAGSDGCILPCSQQSCFHVCELYRLPVCAGAFIKKIVRNALAWVYGPVSLRE